MLLGGAGSRLPQAATKKAAEAERSTLKVPQGSVLPIINLDFRLFFTLCPSLFDKCLKTQETLVFIVVDRTQQNGGNGIVRKLFGGEIWEISDVTAADGRLWRKRKVKAAECLL